MTFDSLGLAAPILKAIADAGYTSPTPIQAQAIPAVLSGGDLMAGAQTGTGKTAGFTLPMLHRLDAGKPVRDARGRIAVRALVLTPTRELAAQVEESVRTYGKYLPLTSMVMFGGVGMQPQIDRLKKGVDILVATPGRLLDHAQQGTLDLSKVEILVLDEADRMLDMGFIHDIKKVLALLPAKKQSLLFSATFSDEIKALADRLLDKPGLIEVARRNATADTIAQLIHPVDRDKKKELLAHLIQKNNWFQVLVFTRMKHGANRLAEFLDKQGISAMAIHGNKSQGARTKALAEFKSGELQVLVATDIAARGIDIDQLPHVVNYELPNVPEDYVHRIGRTGRAGAEGQALSLVCIDEEGFLRDIQKLIKREIPREVVPGYEPDPNAKPEPIVMGRMVLNGGLGKSSGGGAGRPGQGGRPGGGGGGGGGGRPGGNGRRGGGGGQGAARQGQGQGGARAAAPARAPGQGASHGGGRPASSQGGQGASQGGGRSGGGALTRPKR
jgi:ATP-dependent RNA helicase RhlE